MHESTAAPRREPVRIVAGARDVEFIKVIPLVLDSTLKIMYNGDPRMAGLAQRMRLRRDSGPGPSFLKMREACQPLWPAEKGRPIWTAPLAVVQDATDLFSPNSSYCCQRIRPPTVKAEGCRLKVGIPRRLGVWVEG